MICRYLRRGLVRTVHFVRGPQKFKMAGMKAITLTQPWASLGNYIHDYLTH